MKCLKAGRAGVKDMMDDDEDEWREIVRFNCEPEAVTALVRAKRVEWRKEFGMSRIAVESTPPLRVTHVILELLSAAMAKPLSVDSCLRLK